MRYGDGAAKLEGAALAKFMTVLNEYLGFFDKVDKRVRNERVTELLPQARSRQARRLRRREEGLLRRRSKGWKRN